MTAGLKYEIPINDLDTGGIDLAGDGHGFFNPFVTGAQPLANSVFKAVLVRSLRLI